MQHTRGELNFRIREFVEYCNHRRHYKSPGNLTTADVYYGRGQSILDRREKI